MHSTPKSANIEILKITGLQAKQTQGVKQN